MELPPRWLVRHDVQNNGAMPICGLSRGRDVGKALPPARGERVGADGARGVGLGLANETRSDAGVRRDEAIYPLEASQGVPWPNKGSGSRRYFIARRTHLPDRRRLLAARHRYLPESRRCLAAQRGHSPGTRRETAARCGCLHGSRRRSATRLGCSPSSRWCFATRRVQLPVRPQY